MFSLGPEEIVVDETTASMEAMFSLGPSRMEYAEDEAILRHIGDKSTEEAELLHNIDVDMYLNIDKESPGARFDPWFDSDVDSLRYSYSSIELSSLSKSPKSPVTFPTAQMSPFEPPNHDFLLDDLFRPKTTKSPKSPEIREETPVTIVGFAAAVSKTAVDTLATNTKLQYRYRLALGL